LDITLVPLRIRLPRHVSYNCFNTVDAQAYVLPTHVRSWFQCVIINQTHVITLAAFNSQQWDLINDLRSLFGTCFTLFISLYVSAYTVEECQVKTSRVEGIDSVHVFKRFACIGTSVGTHPVYTR
jgi:hypothetical protein